MARRLTLSDATYRYFHDISQTMCTYVLGMTHEFPTGFLSLIHRRRSYDYMLLLSDGLNILTRESKINS